MSDQTKPCAACGNQIASDSRFCRHCGATAASNACVSCEAELSSDARFCRQCGQPVAGGAPASSRPAAAAVPEAPAPAAVAPERPRHPPPPPPPGNRTGLIIGVAVAVGGFAWLVMNKDQPTQSAPFATAAPGAPAAAAPPGAPGPPGTTAPGTPNPHSGGAAPYAAGAPSGGGPYGGAPTAGAAVPPGEPITGTIRIAPELMDLAPSGGVFFVIARPATGGPPIAVSKIDASKEPTPFSIGPEDAMGPAGFDQPVNLTVKWDQDGSVGSQPGDLEGEHAENPVEPGAVGVDVALTRRR